MDVIRYGVFKRTSLFFLLQFQAFLTVLSGTQPDLWLVASSDTSASQ